MKSGGLIPLCVLVLWAFLACRGMPQADPGEGAPHEYGDEGLGGGDLEEDDIPSLALPPDPPPDLWSGDLIEPSLENGEAFLPDPPPEEAVPALAESLPEPEVPELPAPPVPAGAPFPEEAPDLAEEPPLPEEPPDLAEEPSAPEAEPPPPEEPPPPPRIVRPSEPLPPPPPAREIMPMPPKAVPDLPARNPPTLTPNPAMFPGSSSRVVRALAGQTVEVPFRGTGWVYLGESASKRGVDYASRRLDTEGQTFVFRAGEAGVYELKFYRQDFIRDYIINDVVTLMVEEPPPALSGPQPPRSDAAVAVAEPRWPPIAGRTSPETEAAAPVTQAVSPATAGTPSARAGTAPSSSAATAGVPASTAGTSPAKPGTAPSSNAAISEAPAIVTGIPAARAGTVPPVSAAAAGAPTAAGDAETPAAAPSPILPWDTAAEEYLRRAREEYQGERYPQSLAILDQFLERFPRGSDEAYWLYAQICEKQGPSRNIRLALDYYRRLTAEYPQSSHYDAARRRIAYLERYYINIQ